MMQPDPGERNFPSLLGMARAVASLPFRHQQRRAMLGVIRERLIAVDAGNKVPTIAELIGYYPGGAGRYWHDWLEVETVQNDIQLPQVLAVHAAMRQEEIVPYQRQLAALLTAEQPTSPILLRERLDALADHPAYAHLIAAEVREWLTTSSAAAEQKAAATLVGSRTGAPGRPTSMHLILGELSRRIEEGEALEPTKAAMARVLQEWLISNHEGVPQPTVRTIENRIAETYWAEVGKRSSKQDQ